MAADVPLEWSSKPDATGYILEMSIDNGATWINPQDVGNVISYTFPGVPDSGLVLFRNTAYKGTIDNSVVRPEAGAWYNGDWLPVSAPGGTAIP